MLKIALVSNGKNQKLQLEYMSLLKKWTIGVTVTAIILLLVYRLFTKHVDGVKAEKAWFLSELNYDFSGVIDTVNRPNHILFHVTHGHLDTNREMALGQKLKYWGQLVLFLYEGDKVELLNGNAKYQSGDSLYLNSDSNVVRIYRKGHLIKESELMSSLRGRPF